MAVVPFETTVLIRALTEKIIQETSEIFQCTNLDLVLCDNANM